MNSVLCRGAAALVACLLGLAPTGCVTTIETLDPLALEAGEDSPLAQGPVVISLEGDGARSGPTAVLDEYYRNALAQMREAYLERDLPALEALLQVHDRDSAPDWARPRVARFRRLALSLGFDLWLGQTSSIALQPPEPGDGALEGDGDRVPLGAPMRFRLRLGEAPVPERFAQLVLPGERRDHPARVRATLVVKDQDPRGDTGRFTHEILVSLPESHRFGDGPAVLPVEISMPAGNAVIRDVIVALELIPGFLEDASGRGDGPLPHQAVALARGEFSLFPNRVGQVEKDPPGVLARALELEDARFHGHVLLAARFMDDADKPAAIRALMPWVRLGNGAQPDVAMAALRALTGLEQGRQRERWLVWFQDWERTQR